MSISKKDQKVVPTGQLLKEVINNCMITCTGFKVIGSGEGPTAELVFLTILR